MASTSAGYSIAQEIAALAPWFHNLHLPDGTQTAPRHPLIWGDFPASKWANVAGAVPADLTGWRVLDIGCNAGFYTFELARRGAEVLGIDVNAHYLAQARWAAKQFELEDRVEFRQMQVYDLARLEETFDLVWFMGVFYHLRYPLLGLDLAAQKTHRLLMFQTLTMPGEEIVLPAADIDLLKTDEMLAAGWPKLAFIEHRLAGDPTNWWAPNVAAVEALLRSAGLRVVQRLPEEIYLCAPDAENPSCVATWNRAEILSATGTAPGR
jgi:tRNA (mo5U34)-methyltransferase